MNKALTASHIKRRPRMNKALTASHIKRRPRMNKALTASHIKRRPSTDLDEQGTHRVPYKEAAVDRLG
jgi:hypothetical protein